MSDRNISVRSAAAIYPEILKAAQAVYRGVCHQIEEAEREGDGDALGDLYARKELLGEELEFFTSMPRSQSPWSW